MRPGTCVKWLTISKSTYDTQMYRAPWDMENRCQLFPDRFRKTCLEEVVIEQHLQRVISYIDMIIYITYIWQSNHIYDYIYITYIYMAELIGERSKEESTEA